MVRCGFMPNEDTCKQVQRPDPALVQALGGSVFGRVDFDADAAIAWIDTLRDLECDATLEVVRELTEARAAVFAGTLKNGGACFADEECAGEAVCDRTACPGNQLCCTGECVAFRTLSIGQECPFAQDGVRLTARCDDTSYCQPPPDDGTGEPPVSGVCTLRSENGLPCDAPDACRDGARCDVNGSGNCYKLSAAGEMCNPMLAPGSCIGVNDTCDPGSSTCVTAPGAGEPCPQGRCAGWATCMGGDGETPGTCVGYALLGEACDMISCLGDLQCRDGFCQQETTSLVCIEGEPPPPPDPMG